MAFADDPSEFWDALKGAARALACVTQDLLKLQARLAQRAARPSRDGHAKPQPPDDACVRLVFDSMQFVAAQTVRASRLRHRHFVYELCRGPRVLASVDILCERIGQVQGWSVVGQIIDLTGDGASPSSIAIEAQRGAGAPGSPARASISGTRGTAALGPAPNAGGAEFAPRAKPERKGRENPQGGSPPGNEAARDRDVSRTPAHRAGEGAVAPSQAAPPPIESSTSGETLDATLCNPFGEFYFTRHDSGPWRLHVESGGCSWNVAPVLPPELPAAPAASAQDWNTLQAQG